ncbi:hypothetical protein SAMN04489867_0911 [Pedococcus dokdonensis]|uniref:Uncharacterized protein n=1 Tax=Pedococcus dokdonensis TaxID=443156 RepID=A0A1H0NCZ0_9MICO|nr:hypothetical protein [Pedococcus dokdonensis]SDO90582.1 hypothetical protein SAMN04489867_0911 [Pedococcus dokdonensis]
MPDIPSDPTLGTTSTIGKYFGVVSTIPSLIAAAWLYLLAVLQPWTDVIDLGRLKDVNPVKQPSHAVALIAFALVLAVVTHPIQFVLIQLLEGYWGLSRPGIALAHRRAAVHARRRAAANAMHKAYNPVASATASSGLPPPPPPSAPTSGEPSGPSAPPDPAETLRHMLITSASGAVVASYPRNPATVLPTRLGNVLRAYESRGGVAVGLPLLNWTTYIGLVAEPSHTAYVQDQRQELDLAVRMTGVGAFCAGVTALALWPHGAWVLLSFVPYAATWISYRGALSAAHAYGQACEAWLYLNRFKLYEQLHLNLPTTSREERAIGKRLAEMVAANPFFEQEYAHASDGSAAQTP